MHREASEIVRYCKLISTIEQTKSSHGVWGVQDGEEETLNKVRGMYHGESDPSAYLGRRRGRELCIY